MRGVQLPAGQHTVVFAFKPSLTGMKVTLAAVALALVLCGILAVSRNKPEETAAASDEKKPTAQGSKPKS